MTGNESDPFGEPKDPDKAVFDPDNVFGDAAEADDDGSSDTGNEGDISLWGPLPGDAVPDHSTQVLESDAFGRPFLPEPGGDPFAPGPDTSSPWASNGDNDPFFPGGEAPTPGAESEAAPWNPPGFGSPAPERSTHMEHEVPPPWEFESGGPGAEAPAWPQAGSEQQQQQEQQPWQPGSDQQPWQPTPSNGQQDWQPPASGFDPFAAPPEGAQPAGGPWAPGGETGGSPFGPFGGPESGTPGPSSNIPDFSTPQPGGEVPNPFASADPIGSPFGAPDSAPSPFDSAPFQDTSEQSPFGPPPHQGSGDQDDSEPSAPDQPAAEQRQGEQSPFWQPADDSHSTDVLPAPGGFAAPWAQPGEGAPQAPQQQQPWGPWSGDQGQSQPPQPPQVQQPPQPPTPRYDLSQFQQGYQPQQNQQAQPGQQPPQPQQGYQPQQNQQPPAFGFQGFQDPQTQQFQQQFPQQFQGQPQQFQGQQFPGMAGPQQPLPLTSESLSPQALLRPRKAPPTSGWRRAVFKVSGGLIDPGESTKEVQRQQMVTLVRTPVAGGHYRVAVLSLKGGVGKTTTTVGLGSTLASLRGDRIIAVDANPDRGTLSEKVRLETRANVRDMLANREGIQRYSDVRQYTSQAVSRLEVLASDPDPAISEAFSEADYRSIADVLEHYYSICLTDCGTGLLHSAMRGVLGLADQIVLVSSASVDGARSASATLDWLDAHDYSNLVQSGVVVMSAVRPQNKAVDLSRLEQHFSARCRALVRIPFDPHLEAGAEFVLEQLSAPTHDAYLELTAAVAAGFQYRLPR